MSTHSPEVFESAKCTIRSWAGEQLPSSRTLSQCFPGDAQHEDHFWRIWLPASVFIYESRFDVQPRSLPSSTPSKPRRKTSFEYIHTGSVGVYLVYRSESCVKLRSIVLTKEVILRLRIELAMSAPGDCGDCCFCCACFLPSSWCPCFGGSKASGETFEAQVEQQMYDDRAREAELFKAQPGSTHQMEANTLGRQKDRTEIS
ncbi:hypothetical protein Hypma_012204 [Hypsizygus marmoreus]|uniref:Uncharacterized protein n=1 Tax=Hypsizygus marmoreus TaxID=39966 RepID=A0A369JH76_HYPMA|nr:hypothetical protein Hypma_012204 [Hypsizygus marmoreus]